MQKIGIVRSLHDNRRPNVTYALVIVVIDVRMSWAQTSMNYCICYHAHAKKKYTKTLFE